MSVRVDDRFVMGHDAGNGDGCDGRGTDPGFVFSVYRPSAKRAADRFQLATSRGDAGSNGAGSNSEPIDSRRDYR